MAFIRAKSVDGREYYQLVENYREDGRHRQRVLAHLGTSPDVGAAIERHTKDLENLRGTMAHRTSVLNHAHWYYDQEDPLGEHKVGGQIPRPDPNDRPGVRRRRWYKEAEGYWRIRDEIDAATREISRHEERLSALREYRAKEI
jgi:hypothetical protein